MTCCPTSSCRIYIIFAKDEDVVLKAKRSVLECLEHVRQHKIMDVEEFLMDDTLAAQFLPKACQHCAPLAARCAAIPDAPRTLCDRETISNQMFSDPPEPFRGRLGGSEKIRKDPKTSENIRKHPKMIRKDPKRSAPTLWLCTACKSATYTFSQIPFLSFTCFPPPDLLGRAGCRGETFTVSTVNH